MNRRTARVVAPQPTTGIATGATTLPSPPNTGHKPFILGMSYLGSSDHIAGNGVFTLGVSYLGGGDRLDPGEQFVPFILGVTVLGDTRAHL
jgi:hypothetical protein